MNQSEGEKQVAALQDEVRRSAWRVGCFATATLAGVGLLVAVTLVPRLVAARAPWGVVLPFAAGTAASTLVACGCRRLRRGHLLRRALDLPPPDRERALRPLLYQGGDTARMAAALLRAIPPAPAELSPTAAPDGRGGELAADQTQRDEGE